MARNERIFCTELHRSARSITPCFWWKIPDAGFRNHFDIVCCKNGFIAIEAKISKNSISIPLQQLFYKRHHEIHAVSRVKKSGGHGYVLINVFVPREINTVYVFSINDYISLCKRILPKKSIKLSDPILKMFPQMKKIKTDTGNIWDLNTIINYEQIQTKLQKQHHEKKAG